MLEFLINSLIVFGHVLTCFVFVALLALLVVAMWQIATKPVEEYEDED